MQAVPMSELTYVSGPMSSVGPPTWNYPAFNAMAQKLRDKGLNVINPAELHEADENVSWDWYLRRELVQLVKCGRIVMLPGWTESKGATLERTVAKALGMEVVYVNGDGELADASTH